MTTFRPGSPSDLETVLALHQAFFEEDGYPFREAEARANLARLVADPGLGRLLVMDDGGEVVGYLVVGFGFSLEFRGRDAFLDEIYVVPSHRGRGLGTRAIAAAEATCREAGVRALHLEVERSKERTQGLYRRLGFAAHDRFLMTKWLE